MRVAVVGATGAVGTLLLDLLERRGFAADEIVPFASERSAGKELRGATIQPLNDETVQGFDVALFSAGGSTSKAWAERFVAGGATVVDNSSAWRMDDDVPLVVTEVNPDALELRAMVATSFQAAGGAGQKGMDELAGQIDTVRAGDLVNDGAAAAASV